MFVDWRGWGPLALVALFLPLLSCIGLIDKNPLWFGLVCGLALLGGGVICWTCGRHWNRLATEHSVYGIPLQYWGMLYMAFGGLLLLTFAAAMIRTLHAGF